MSGKLGENARSPAVIRVIVVKGCSWSTRWMSLLKRAGAFGLAVSWAWSRWRWRVGLNSWWSGSRRRFRRRIPSGSRAGPGGCIGRCRACGRGLRGAACHAGGFVVGGQLELLAVEGVDFRADGLVFVGDDAVGDAGVDEGHFHGAVAEQGGDRLQPHAPVDGLGGQGVAELVGVDADAAAAADAADDAADLVAVQRAAVIGDQAPVAADVIGVGGGPGGEERDELGVQRDIAVVAELAERDAQPVACPMSTTASASRSASSPARMPVRASSSMTRRSRGSGQARAAAMSWAASRSSRNLGSGSGRGGMSPPKTGLRAGASGQSHSMIRSKNTRSIRSRWPIGVS